MPPTEPTMDDFKLTQADWDPYRGNNHREIAAPNVMAGGCVSFSRHLGKPLSQDLWEDLVHRLCVGGICIYDTKKHTAQWCCGWPPYHVIITLDADDNVKDIDYFPPWRTPR